MNYGKIKTRLLMIGASFFIVLFIIVGVFFVLSARKTLHDEKANYLQEIALKSANGIKKEVKGMFSTIESLATFIGEHDDYNRDHSLAIMQIENERNSFKRMGIVDLDGTAHTTDGLIADFRDREYFKDALKGKTSISDRLEDKFEKEKDDSGINVLATPIYHSKEIVAVLFATKTQEEFSENLKIESFDGKGYSYVINSSGVPVIKTTHPDSIVNMNNLFDELSLCNLKDTTADEFKSNIQLGADGAFEYVRGGVKRYLCYTKIDISDWYIISTVPTSAISYKSDELIAQMIIMVSLIIGVIIVVALLSMLTLRRTNKRLSQIAFTDKVTGYSNWHKFDIDAKTLLDKNPTEHFAMITADISKFKVINDVFGHERGNELLTYMADIINSQMQPDELFSRTSADNFNILMKFETEEILVERLSYIVDKTQSYIDGYKIEIFVGIYPIADNTLSVSALSDRATISKIIAKKNKTTFYHFFKEQNRLELLNENEIENSMEKALVNGEFEVYLQPKILTSSANKSGEVKNAQIVGAEALTRWNRLGVGIVSPQVFVPIFEKNGFICKMDLYIFEQVCILIKKWTDSGNCKIVPISVNISRAHLSNANLAQTLFNIAKKHGVDPSLLEIELTESAVFSDAQSMIRIMQKIKECGFKLSIDDFGSGYSSLSTLKDVPADFVKLDKSFLDQSQDAKGEKIVEGIVSLAKGLGLVTVAEGAETDSQMQMLKNVGCQITQGFWFSRPVTVFEFEKKMQVSQKN